MLLLTALAVCAVQLAADGAIPKPTVLYFKQKVDHFGALPSDSYQQRYLLTEEYWSQQGPAVLFFYTGNEGSIDQFYDNSGFVFEAAENCSCKALVVFGEHRYYGESLPYGEKSFDHDKVSYLMIEQAMADYVDLIAYLREKYHFTRVISFGGSYGGQLSAYMRFKYPFVVDGAIAASAPIYEVAGLVSGQLFWKAVTEDYDGANPGCPKKVREAFGAIEEARANGTAGLEKISKAFSLCSPLTSQDMVDYLIGWIMNAFASLCMVDYPYPSTFLGPVPANPVNVSCEILMNTSDPMTALAKAVGLFYNSSKLSCYNITAEYVECADPTGCGTGDAAKAWDYQACTEEFMDASTNNVTDMFPPRIFNSTTYCRNTWGVERRFDWPRIHFWGKDIFSASNIFFSNGNLDPWRLGGVLDVGNHTSLKTFLVIGGAHHLDLRSSNPKDPPSVIECRQEELKSIKQWIGIV